MQDHIAGGHRELQRVGQPAPLCPAACLSATRAVASLWHWSLSLVWGRAHPLALRVLLCVLLPWRVSLCVVHLGCISATHHILGVGVGLLQASAAEFSRFCSVHSLCFQGGKQEDHPRASESCAGRAVRRAARGAPCSALSHGRGVCPSSCAQASPGMVMAAAARALEPRICSQACASSWNSTLADRSLLGRAPGMLCARGGPCAKAREGRVPGTWCAISDALGTISEDSGSVGGDRAGCPLGRTLGQNPGSGRGGSLGAGG